MLLYLLAVLLLVPLAALALMFATDPSEAPLAGHESNPDLPNLLPTDEWPGTPVDAKGRFVNQEFPFLPKAAALLKWQTQANPRRAEKKQTTWQMPVVTDSSFLTGEDDVLVWLGHATYYIRLNGVRLLTDPVFGNVSTVKRLHPFPINPALLRDLDYVLVSHNHRDHADETSLRQVAQQNPQATYLTGLRLDTLLAEWTGSRHIQAAGWYQQYQTDTTRLKISYLPSRHWARRGLLDINTQLWGGYLIQAKGITIYFGGDSGYGSHFQQIGQRFPGIDYSLLGVGAYQPEWFMGGSHMSPTDAVKAFRDLGARRLLPMHYGTYDLADEPPGDPRQVLERLQKSGQIGPELLLVNPGQVVPLEVVQ
ncbi:MAG: MBL fold metallo-hydrolase [Bernardetiaceae bacterium]|nr:MBL fold metallo-hydrolase [Bernardetiaceae bacterium]